ncbi:MAG: hypothetical protein KDE51_10590 [Anaerolineales bacterium]|nr:hypothetical protein [Anaerolineales bacterium]
MSKRSGFFRLVVASLFACLAIGGYGALQIVQGESWFSTGTAASRPFSYEFVWHNQTTTPITNDLGYTITLEEGYVANATIELIPCESELAWLAPAVAYAGHGTGEIDASRVVVTLVESLTEPQRVTFTAVHSSTTTYCQAYYLVAPQLDQNEQIYNGVDMSQKSLYVRGFYTAAGSTTTIPFEIETHLPWGTFGDLHYESAQASNGHIIVQRQFDTLFDGVDFAQQPAAEQATIMLRGLLENTVFITTK